MTLGRLVAAIAVCVTGLSGCGPKQVATGAPPPPTVSVTQAVMYPVQSYYEYNGTLDAVESVQITARVKGFLNEIAFKEGDEVEKGALLFKIDPREYDASVKRAEADRRKAVTELKLAKLEEERFGKLRATRATSEQEYEQRVATREMAEAVLMQTDAAVEAGALQRGYADIYAPIDGQISRALVTRGNLVGRNEETPLTSIVRMDQLYVFFDVPERDLVEYQRTMKPGEREELLSGGIPVEIGVATETGYPHPGKIDFRENRVDPGTGTVRIRGRIPNPRVAPANARILYPGLYARVRVPAGPPHSMPAIIEDALMTGQEGTYVYVLDKDNVVQKRTVKVGPVIAKSAPPAAPAKGADPEKKPAPVGWMLKPPAGVAGDEPVPVASVVAIESGLSPEDRVIYSGLTKARPGAPVAPQDWKLQPPPLPASATEVKTP